MIKEIGEKIIELLQSDENLSFDWYFEPPVRAKAFPYGFVDYAGGAFERKTSGGATYNWTYYIVIVDRKRSDTDNIEKAVMDRVEKAMDILRSNPSLDGLAFDSEVSAVEGDYAMVDGNYMIGSRLTLRVRVWK
ncbi:MAG: hypothetical protein QXF26_09420 [Candidatus Bathyarchaeia archaeon]